MTSTNLTLMSRTVIWTLIYLFIHSFFFFEDFKQNILVFILSACICICSKIDKTPHGLSIPNTFSASAHDTLRQSRVAFYSFCFECWFELRHYYYFFFLLSPFSFLTSFAGTPSSFFSLWVDDREISDWKIKFKIKSKHTHAHTHTCARNNDQRNLVAFLKEW